MYTVAVVNEEKHTRNVKRDAAKASEKKVVRGGKVDSIVSFFHSFALCFLFLLAANIYSQTYGQMRTWLIHKDSRKHAHTHAYAYSNTAMA